MAENDPRGLYKEENCGGNRRGVWGVGWYRGKLREELGLK